MKSIIVIGGGLAGCEAALQLAHRGISVELFEMRPVMKTPAHQTDGLAELVCSNGLGSLGENTAPWLIKKELKRLGSCLLEIAERTSVPAGLSLAIDRRLFSQQVTAAIEASPRISLHRAEWTDIPIDRLCIIASGPLTSNDLAAALARTLGERSLYFYDAISPIISAESVDRTKVFAQSRYNKGEADFLNAPLSREHYEAFVTELLKAEVVLPHNFEESRYFEGCMPIEALAERGVQTLAFGPMKPVGLTDPHTGRRPHAVVQLRAENRYLTAYNLVGFQTKLKHSEQTRIFRMIPGLENAEFLRLGSMHRNTYINSPRHLRPTLQLHASKRTLIAGQLTGTEGYVESIATGLLAGMNAAHLALGEPPVTLPAETMLGALVAAITDQGRVNFQPMNCNMGLLPPAGSHKQKAERNAALCGRALSTLDVWISDHLESYRDAPHEGNPRTVSSMARIDS